MGVKRVLVVIFPVIWEAFADVPINTTCSNHFSNSNIPVVTICADSYASGGSIVIDGYYANTITDKTCSCLVKSNENQEFSLKEASNFNPEINRTLCGSFIQVQSHYAAIQFVCSQQGSLKVTKNEEISIKLYKNISSADTRYCFILGQESNSFDVSCFGNHIFSTKIEEEITVNTAESSELNTTEAPTTTVLTTEQIPKSSENTSSVLNPVHLDSNAVYMYVGIGSGSGAVLIIASVVAACTRRRALSSRDQIYESPKRDDDDEQHYNVLYTSSVDSVTNSTSIDKTKTSHCTEESYETINIGKTSAMSKNHQFNAIAKQSANPDILYQNQIPPLQQKEKVAESKLLNKMRQQ